MGNVARRTSRTRIGIIAAIVAVLLLVPVILVVTGGRSAASSTVLSILDGSAQVPTVASGSHRVLTASSWRSGTGSRRRRTVTP